MLLSWWNNVDKKVFHNEILRKFNELKRQITKHATGGVIKKFEKICFQTIDSKLLLHNLSYGKYGLVVAKKSKLILLEEQNSILVTSINWKDLLLLLKGNTVILATPKKNYAHNGGITSDIAIFCIFIVTYNYKI